MFNVNKLKSVIFFSLIINSLIPLGSVSGSESTPNYLYVGPPSPPRNFEIITWTENSTDSVPLSYSPFYLVSSAETRDLAKTGFKTVLEDCAVQTTPEIGCIEVRYSKLPTDDLKSPSSRSTTEHRGVAWGIPDGDGFDFMYTSTWPRDDSNGLFAASFPNVYQLEDTPHSLGDDYLINAVLTQIIVGDKAIIEGLEVEVVAGKRRNVGRGTLCKYWGVENVPLDPLDPLVNYCFDPVSLPPDLVVEVKVKLGERINELSGWFDGRLKNANIIFDNNDGIITIQGSPLAVNHFASDEVPLDTDHPLYNDASGPIGVRNPRDGLADFKDLLASGKIPPKSVQIDNVWRINSWQKNVGIDKCSSNSGLQGIVITNATTYSPDPPSFNLETGNLSFQVASTSLQPDGEPNEGYYQLVIRDTLANCLWGINNASLADVQVTGVSGNNKSAITSLRKENNWFIFTAEKFSYSVSNILIGYKASATKSKSSSRLTQKIPEILLQEQDLRIKIPKTIKAGKVIKLPAKSQEGLKVQVKVKGSCSIKYNYKTTFIREKNKIIKKTKLKSYSIQVNDNGKTCRIVQTNKGNAQFAPIKIINTLKIRL